MLLKTRCRRSLSGLDDRRGEGEIDRKALGDQGARRYSRVVATDFEESRLVARRGEKYWELMSRFQLLGDDEAVRVLHALRACQPLTQEMAIGVHVSHSDFQEVVWAWGELVAFEDFVERQDRVAEAFSK